MDRLVEPEWLDELPVDDPRALRSRQDLRRVNVLMGHARILSRRLRQAGAERRMDCLIDLGAGDGSFLLELVTRLAPKFQLRRIVLVDRQRVRNSAAVEEFKPIGCEVEIVAADVFEWLAGRNLADGVVMIANLFLHHFSGEQLQLLFRLVAAGCDLFAACEPRRSALPLLASRLLGLIGGNDVTRHDAVASVRAGFAGRELSALWPADSGWELREEEAGLFSHCLVATRSAERPA